MLKLIALLLMVLDHLGYFFFPDQEWMRAVGRLAMPIFAFAIARGFYYTSNRRKYLLRMGLLALISQGPFMFAFGAEEVVATPWGSFSMPMLSMIVTWTVGLGLLFAPFWVTVLAFPLLVAVPLEYTALAVLLPAAFYHFWFKRKILPLAYGAPLLVLSSIALVSSPVQWWALAAIPVIALVEPFDKKLQLNKWIFYCFYPVHLVVFKVLADAIA